MDPTPTPSCLARGGWRGDPDAGHARYRLPDLSVGDSNDEDPLTQYTWSDLRALIYAAPTDLPEYYS